MPAKVTRSTSVSLTAFVDCFANELGGSIRRDACVSYLQGLLVGSNKGRRSAASSIKRAHNLRYFVNRSPWSHEAVMHRLRSSIRSQGIPHNGALVLSEIQLLRQGRETVGCDLQDITQPTPRLWQRPRNCQSVIAWFWVTPHHAWPVAGRLYLPYRWTLRTRQLQRTGVPPDHRQHQTKEVIALGLLDDIRSEFGQDTPVLVDDSFTESWELYEKLERHRGAMIAKLDPLKLWPMDSPTLTKNLPHSMWGVLDRHVHTAVNRTWCVEMAQRFKSRSITKSVPPMRRAQASEAPKSDRYLFLKKDERDALGVYLFNKPTPEHDDITAMSERFALVRDTCARLKDTGGLRRFEGRTWLGLHHHLTLCFMAEHFRLKHGAAI